MFTTEIISPYR